ncbi:uncharacterized protein HMPREF1541_01768 [Cyphellophora europaea CBS 101466]|uniref:COP9 signalosome complex subunit 3 N-terminal helical repeats domain-containing protein n=1 Tax=Cyphellophora europaea (strain CBS 101466) TaxID=1220924 RepID=W2S1K8_CYPE1|nr:uncharacterized protein HMPREF1541_01768 [Cyphellophora europaea CBS 101466]ETN42611.1 hypothetical protein HMPREF1541_01768 [Cyphellophora europaea CBS 101466]
MDKLLAEGASLTPALLASDEDSYDKQATNLSAKLQAIPAAQLVSKDVLDSLEPTAQTITYLSIVSAGIKNVTGSGKAVSGQLARSLLPDQDFWPYITNILLNFDPIQVRYAGHCLTEIVTVVGIGAEQTQNYVPAIQLLSNVILRLDTSSSTFTSTHHIYVRLCLRARAYADALNIIDRPIYHIPASIDKQVEARAYKYRCSVQDSSASYITLASGLTQKITSRMFLDYNFMCALCYMALGQYSKAIPLLEVILIAPTASGVTSLLAVEAYKKWVLLNLLILGYLPEYPRPAYQATMRNVRTLAKPYDCLAETFKQREPQRLFAEANEGQTVWQEDCNMGLVMEVLQAHRKYSVLRMAKLFASVNVSHVEAQLPPDQNGTPIQVYLQNLISTGELRATITPSQDGSDQILRFLPEATSTRSEAATEQQLNSRSQLLHALIKHVGDAEYCMEISKEHIDTLKKLKKNRDDDNKKGPGSKPSATLDEMDEDMMADEL